MKELLFVPIVPMAAGLFPTDDELPHFVVGPESLTWQFGSDVRLFATMLYPLLLQVAHPTVDAGVRDFSDFERRPWDRLTGTLDYLLVLHYGGHDAAAMGRRLRAVHKSVKGVKPDGERYHALEPPAYGWVHATLLDAYVSGHAHFGRPMRREQVERFYREYRNLGRLVGVRDGDLPSDWSGFRSYFDDVVAHELRHTESVDRVLRAVRTAALPEVPLLADIAWRALRIPVRRALYVCSIGLLPRDLRTRLGISWSRRDELEFRAVGAASRSLTPLMPQGLKVSGPAQLRWRRRAIASGPLGTGDEAAGREPAAA